MAELVRVAALTGYFEAMARFGVDPRPLLREQGLGIDLLINPEQIIPAVAAIRLLERSAEATGCETLGLSMAQGRSLANLGATSLLIAHQPTLRRALEALREFRVRVNSTLMLHYDEADDIAILREDFQLSRSEPSRQSSELALAVLARLCMSVLTPGWAPLNVCFVHGAPSRPALASYQDVFGCRPIFNSEFNGLVIHRADLDLPNPQADEQLARHARQLLTAVAEAQPSSYAEQTEHLIRILLPAGKASVQICAATLGKTVRSLQRALDAEGTCFSALMDQARQQLARQYLANPRLRITDIADLLGYGSIGAFSRWHKTAFGQPPRTCRAEQQPINRWFQDRPKV
ncbi:MAG: AraC family transcriptional regulator [Chakrabartia sp.]